MSNQFDKCTKSLLEYDGAIEDYFESGYDMTDALGLMYYIKEYYQKQTITTLSLAKYIGDMNFRCRIVK